MSEIVEQGRYWDRVDEAEKAYRTRCRDMLLQVAWEYCVQVDDLRKRMQPVEEGGDDRQD